MAAERRGRRAPGGSPFCQPGRNAFWSRQEEIPARRGPVSPGRVTKRSGTAAQHRLRRQESPVCGGVFLFAEKSGPGGVCLWPRKEGIRIFRKLKEDIDAVMERDPAARSRLEVFFLYSGFKAVRAHRQANWFYRHNMKFMARLISQRARKKTGIEIHPAAKIGRGLFIDHGMGVVIGETTEIGDNCTLYQNVTMGGTGKDTGKRHPTLGNNVLVGAGAKVLGPFTVGDNARVAAGAVVLDAVPPDATAVGVPARVVKIGNTKVGPASRQLDQIHIADPVSMELCRLRGELERLQAKVEELASGGSGGLFEEKAP